MTLAALADFTKTFAPALASSENSMYVRNVELGGNRFLTTIPKAKQGMYARPVLQQVAHVAPGALKWIAHGFSLLFHPVICFPLSIVSSAVRGKFYESSVGVPVGEQTRYFERGKEVPLPILGTVPLMVDGTLRHFFLGRENTWEIEHNIEIEEEGQKKWFTYGRLGANKPFNDKRCREVTLDGQKVRIELYHELGLEDRNYVEILVGGRRRCYRLGTEAAAPVQGTVEVQEGWRRKHYLVGKEMDGEGPNCIKIKSQRGTLHYETGVELAGPQKDSRSFVIDGKRRHFASAKFVPSETLGLSGLLNKIPKIPFKLPTRLHRFSVRILEFINNHMSNIIRVAIAVSGVVLALFGHLYLALGALVAVTYEYLDHSLGVIPRRVSAFMEKWMPIISMTGLLIVGSLYSQILAGATLLLMIPSVNLWTHHKVSRLMRSIMLSLKTYLINRMEKKNGAESVKGHEEFDRVLQKHPLLEECDAPWVQNKNLTKQQIDAILAVDEPERLFEFNPAHFTKIDPPLYKLPENRQFNELLRLWDRVGPKWLSEASYQQFVKALLDDEHFLELLQEKCGGKRFEYENQPDLTDQGNAKKRREKQEDYAKQAEEWIDQLAKQNHCTKNEFVARWIREQLALFVEKLNGTRPIEGEQRFLTEAIEKVSQILPFLLKPDISPAALEGALAKLAIEGGGYCALGMARASAEVWEGFIEPLEEEYFNQQPGAGFDMQRFERQARHNLLQARRRLLQNAYKGGVIDLFRDKGQLSHTGEDVHLYTAIMRAMKRGFYPLDKEDMNEFNMTELLINQTMMLALHIYLIKEYRKQVMWMKGQDKPPGEMIELGKYGKMLDYLRAWVSQNKALSAEERTSLLKGILSTEDDNVVDSENHPKWANLMLYVLGIIRFAKNPPPPKPKPEPVLSYRRPQPVSS